MMNTSESLKKLVAENKIEAALDALSSHVTTVEQQDMLAGLGARFNDLSRQTRLGVIDFESATIERNKIVSALLQLINDLDIQSSGERTIGGLKSNKFGKRLALVVGCNLYEYAGELKNPLNDARVMKEKLEILGFKVILRENPTLRDLKMTVDDFGIELKNSYSVGLFYFAGHGIQVDGHNYLVPVEANLLAERFVEYDCLRADRVLGHMEQCETEVNIVILDACRNNPFERSWGRGMAGRGLAMMDAPQGSFIAYATAPGKTASDGEGENGLYTEFLSQEIGAKNLPITQLFQRIRKGVMGKSNNQQIPWEATSLTSDFYFNP
jgi:uncharacterized caspase-like protein